MSSSFSLHRHVIAPGLVVALLAFTGCDGKKVGPKREDHEAAHSARYHPEIRRSADQAASRPAAAQPFELTLPSDIPEGVTGSPVMFVIGKPLTVQEVLEPLLPELQQMAASAASEREYYRNIARIVAEQIRHQASTIILYEQARKKLPESAEETLNKEADKAIQRVVVARFGGVRTRYETHLRALNLTINDVRDRVKRELLVSNFLHQRFEPLVSDPPRRDLLRYYNAHLADFTTPAKAELLMIEIPLREELGKPLSAASEQEIADARQRARDRLRRAREELDSGVEFAAVARRYSLGAQRSRGGSWGEISPGSLTGSWTTAADVLFALEQGQVSGIIETDEASFIIKCGRKVPQTTLPFEEAQVQIVDRIRDEEYARITSAFIGDLLTKAAIDQQQQQAFFVAAVMAAPRPVGGQPAGTADNNAPN